ncbi:MAG TPA: glycosyltransferase family A protein, partial [Phycisphaerae bacterium]|nr:glycosyltransferase family A protein [Phycisphaerae bacterium]
MAESTPLVSITSTVYNTRPYLLDMIKSILGQTFTDFEFVLLDDGSTDGSLELAQSVVDPRIRVFSNGTNRGRSYTLNRLTGLSRGQYIARMDSDDLSAPTRIERQVEFLERHPKVDVVGTGVVYVSRDCAPLGIRRFPSTHAEICCTPMRHFWIGHGTLLARRTWFERFRYDESIGLAVDANMRDLSISGNTVSGAGLPGTLDLVEAVAPGLLPTEIADLALPDWGVLGIGLIGADSANVDDFVILDNTVS